MNRSSTQAADTRAAQAALTRPTIPGPDAFDRYLIIDDTLDDVTKFVTLLRERMPRGLAVQS